MARDIHYTSQDGLNLYARERGPEDAPLTVLCMHGLTRNHKDFDPMIDALDAPWRFISVDVRGRGLSDRDPDPGNYTPMVYARDMRALLDQLGLQRVALIGTSMGGLMAMVMMKMMPKRIAGTVLNDVGPQLENAGLTRIASYVDAVEPVEGWPAAAAAVERAQSAVFSDYGPEDWLAFAQRTYRELEDGRVILDYDPAITRTVGDVRPGWRTRFAMWRLFSSMKKKPLLILRGETSDILSEKTANRMARRHKNAMIVTVPRVGHAPMLDEPAAVDAIRGFLDQLAH